MYSFRQIALAATLGLGLGAFLGAVPMSHVDAATPVAARTDSKVDSGTIKSIDAANNRFVLTIGEREVTIRVNEKTSYTLDGEASTMSAALKAGANARVTHEDYLASSVAVTTSKPK